MLRPRPLGQLRVAAAWSVKLKAVAVLLLAWAGKGACQGAAEAPAPFLLPAVKPCPAEAVARLGAHFFVEDGRIHGLKFAADGSSVMAFSDHGARRWRLASGTGETVPGARRPREAEAISADGLRVATSQDGVTWIRARNGAGQPVKMDGGGSFMPWLAFSPDGKWLAGSCDIRAGDVTYSSTRVWDAATGAALHNRPGNSEAGVFSPDGSRLAVSQLAQVILLETSTWQERLRLSGVLQHVWGMDFSPDGKWLATGEDQRIRFWDARTGQEVMAGTGHSEPIQTVAFAPDGRTIFTGGLDGRIILWSWPEGQEVRRIEQVGSSWGVQALTLSPDGRVLAATAWVNLGDPFRLFDVGSGQPLAAFGKDLPGQGPITWAPSGKEVVTGIDRNDGGFAVWDAGSGARLRTQGQSPDGIVSVAFAPGGQGLWCVSRYGRVELRDWASGKEVRVLKERAGAGGNHLTLGAEGGWLAVGNKVWDLDSGQLIRGGPDDNPPVSISPDGRLLALGEENAVSLWELMTRKEIHRFKLDTGPVKALAFAPDGTVLVSSDYDDALVWDMTGRLQRGRLVAESLSPAAMGSLWQTLAGEEGWAAYLAAWRLAAGGEASAEFLAARLHPAAADPAQVAALHEQLSNTNFDARERAARELLDRGIKLQPAELQALRRPSPLVDARATRWDMEHPVASGLPGVLLPPPSLLPLPERLRSSRALLALEHNPSPEAEALLRLLAGGVASAPQTVEAKAALVRRGALAR